ncbi:hypothetical protein [Chitinophaga sp. YIM B06452]|uniref:hypothetical protein n=1 Tax=Chitinophaga sp. YIM B06452 TaxID=3082158 RepID=UPI0031FE4C48
MKIPCTLLLFCMAYGCAVTTHNAEGRRCFKRHKRMLVKAHFTGKLMDQYIKLYRGNYYKAYERVLGLSKIAESTGRYRLSGDTIFLFPCDSLIRNWSDTLRIDSGSIIVPLTDMNHSYSLTIEKDRRAPK